VRMGRAALPAITAIAYLLIATTPCPPSAELHSAASPHSTAASDDSAALTAPCPCDCEHGANSLSFAKRGEPAALIAAAPPLAAPAPSLAHEREERVPDAPISVDSPVPIAS